MPESHIHAVAVAHSVQDLKYLIYMIQKECGCDIEKMECHAVKEVIKDVYGGIRYEQRSESDSNEHHEPDFFWWPLWPPEKKVIQQVVLPSEELE